MKSIERFCVAIFLALVVFGSAIAAPLADQTSTTEESSQRATQVNVVDNMNQTCGQPKDVEGQGSFSADELRLLDKARSRFPEKVCAIWLNRKAA